MQRMITMSEFDKNSENIDEDDDLEYLINLYGRDILSSPWVCSLRKHSDSTAGCRYTNIPWRWLGCA